MSEHTPGPWSVDVRRLHTTIVAADGTDVLTVAYLGDYSGTAFSDIPEPADALVIAAAPDMLAALKEAVRLFECYGLVAKQVPGDPMAAGRWNAQVRAAIAKAEGRS